MTTAQAQTTAPDGPANDPEATPATQLQESTKQHIREGLEAIAATPGFRSRGSQRRMIAEVAKTLSGEYGGDENILCAEGPTGTGKSLGYLLPAIPVAQAREKTLVVATATVALQEQLVTKDLPDLQQRTNLEFTFALAKGRRRYVCDRNLERLAGVNHDQELLDFGDGEHEQAHWSFKPEDGEIETVHKLWQAREDGSWNGDLDMWGSPLRGELHGEVTTDRSGCTARTCPFRGRCAFLSAKKAQKEKDVIVANHALVIADLMLGGGVVLPAPADCIYVFDEGHHLPDAAINQGAAQTRLLGPQSWLQELGKLPRRAANAMPGQKDNAQALEEVGQDLTAFTPRLVDALRDLHRSLSDCHPAMANDTQTGGQGKGKGKNTEPDPNWRFAHGRVPDELREQFEQARAACESVMGLTIKLSDQLRKGAENEPDNRRLGSAQASVQWIANRLDSMSQALTWLSSVPQSNPDAPPAARWIECIGQGSDFACAASPTSAAGLLRSILWSKCDGAVVTSATLTSLGRFDRLFEHTGLGPAHGTRALQLPSPFDYANNAELVVPAVAASPKDHDAHTAEIIRRIDDGLIDSSAGTLVLFASYRQMNAVARGVSKAIGDRILTQGSAPRHELLDTHRQRIAAGEDSILFGVSSFSEGVDLPGDQCTHVIIAKIPFSVPTSPVDATRAEWLESKGRNPFMEMSVPDACFKLIQASGRLLRTESDVGRVTVLDRRLADMPYGRSMMDSLPPFRRVKASRHS